MAKGGGLDIFSNWYHLLDGLQASPKEFYAAVESHISERRIPGASISRVDWPEGGVLSARREYLRVTRKPHIFDICGAPFGTGFFVSWWLGELPGCLSNVPLFSRLTGKWTYYRMDTAFMFQEAVSRAVWEVVDEISQAKGLRALSELERKPILRDLMR